MPFVLRTNSELVGELNSKEPAPRTPSGRGQRAGCRRYKGKANGYCRILWQLRVLAWDWTGLNGLVTDSGDGVWGIGA